MDNVHLVWNPGAPRFIGLVKAAYRQQARAYVADLHDGSYLLVYLLQGPEAAGRRFPRLEFLSLRDADTVERLLAPAEAGNP
jgi:hypothetical protein